MGNNKRFNNHFSEHVQILNGTQIRLRLIRPDDKQLMLKAFEHLSSNSRYKRFLGTKNALSSQELSYFTEIDQYNHFALCALTLDKNDNEIGVAGIARFVRLLNNSDCAEVGIMVIDSAQGKGIGQLLLERLFAAATERDIKRLRFECLSDNHNLLHLVKKLNVHVKFEREHELLIAEIEIPKPNKVTNKYPMDVVEDLNVLMRVFSTKALIIYTEFSFKMLKHTMDIATEFAEKEKAKLMVCS